MIKAFLVIAWIIFFIWLGGKLNKLSSKMYKTHGWLVAISTLISLEIIWFIIYFTGLWVIVTYIP